MESVGQGAAKIRFGEFEMDTAAGELRKSGQLVSLPPQPFKVLALLVRRAGEPVTRDQIREEIWGNQTVVDFERGLNFAINKVRSALGDNADSPAYIQTLPRRGYRFVCPVQTVPAAGEPKAEEADPISRPRIPRNRRLAITAGLAVCAGVSMAAVFYLRPTRGVADGTIRSIAVLPFETLTHAAADEFLSDGTTDALITELGRIAALRVTSRTSSGLYRRPAKPAKAIARELGVDALVEGAVLRSGDRVRVSVQLIDAAADRQIWSDSYDRSVGDILTLQGEIARSIAAAIRVRLTSQQRSTLSLSRPVNPEAYELYVRGRFYWNRVTVDGSRKAIADFENALSHDPKFALAYAGLADAYAGLPVSTGTPAEDALAKAKQAAGQALAIDPNLVEAVNVLAEVAEYSWNWPEAERLFKRVFELNPSYAQAYHDYGFYLLAMNRVNDAITWTRKACMLDPLSVYFAADLAFNPYQLGNTDESIRQLRLTLAMDPQFPTTHMYLAMAYAGKGEFDNALAAAKRSVELDPEDLFTTGTLGYVYGKAGKTREARQILERLHETARHRRVSAYHFAFVQIGLGNRELALDYLWKAYEERFYILPVMNVTPEFAPLRTETRYQELLRLMGVPH
jgi:TolB-like protein/DNA-binding winged helix-turn-helix (wHTH) protein/Tfp pilus assembly protein PilF